MTSHARQDARDKAGTGWLTTKAEWYGATTQRHVRFDEIDGEVKVKHEDGDIDVVDYNALLGWDELLPWQQDNEFILTSHRRATNSYLRSLKSVFRVHNETVNIWSHVMGVAIFFCAAVLLYLRRNSKGHLDGRYSMNADDMAVGIYFLSVITCFFFSFIYHIFLDHSECTRTWTCRFDYLGIVIPLWGTTVSSTHFGFYCEPGLQNAYAIIGTFAGLACAVTTLHPSFAGPASRRFRTGMYVFLGLSSFLPIIYGILLFGLDAMNKRMSLWCYVALGLLHGSGATLYASRVPERWWPGRCDVVGSSHQVMHVLVVLGAAVYAAGVLRAREYWTGVSCVTLH
ncbi:hypothetical protein PtrM4_128640 [Pyrenophora tritici-repentis]|uniref:HlyIII-domain-containing protein n=1 Tax=Pyrenophora tritici-repentis TaxID=45151 RepID=A0A834VL11_9PLEO|nr:hypothetical protein PtrM4_128640 [Pyrenophora tritici-repentis]